MIIININKLLKTKIFILIIIIVGCSHKDQIDISFIPTLDGIPFDCSTITSDIRLTDLRFYIHNIRLIEASGSSTPVLLENRGEWQQNNLALIDLDNNEGNCINGTPGFNQKIIGKYKRGDYKNLEFTIGVPFHLNHIDPFKAPNILSYSDMHWHWNSGYKFFRLGVITNNNDGFFLHLGSSGCIGTIGNITKCNYPNRPTINIPNFTSNNKIYIDIRKLLQGTNLKDQYIENCQSAPNDIDCEIPFDSLGINQDISNNIKDTQDLFYLD